MGPGRRQSAYRSPRSRLARDGPCAAERLARAERLGPDEEFEMSSEIVAVEGDSEAVRIEVGYGPPSQPGAPADGGE
jgi:hypothetical protein